jgi:AcrR family transcriptional regulator
MSTSTAGNKDARKHQTPKSIATRRSILDATVRCFVEIGYHRTTTTEISKRADVTRGAVQYYFPTTPDVLRASIEYLLEEWTDAYTEALKLRPPEANKYEFAIDTYWEFLKNPLYTAWQELIAASRTDEELQKIVQHASIINDVRRREMGHEIMPELDELASDDFSLGRDFGRVLLEGLSTTQLTYDRDRREQAIINLLKKTVTNFWEEAEEKARSGKAD